MCRFYSLWDAINELVELIKIDPEANKADKHDLTDAMQGLDKEILFRVISFLKPLYRG